MKRILFVSIFFIVSKFILQLAASGPPDLRAQTKVKGAQEPLQYEVTVAIKLVQVYVTDPKGNPARDLEITDFVLYDNGKLQTITGFEKHFLAAPGTAPISSRLAETKLVLPRDTLSLMNRKFIFLIDYGTNNPEGIMKSKNAALEFMDTKLQAGDEVALFSFSTISGLTLHEYLTSDHEKVRAAIKKIRDTPGILKSGMEDVSLDHEPMGMDLMSLEVFARHGGHGGASRRDFFSEVKEWAKALGHIPGQKSIILFSRGYGYRPNTVLAGPFDAMAQELASANAPVFSVNTTTGVVDKIKAGVFPESSLEHLSKLTGGKYFYDVNYYSKIAEDIQNATSNYYVLSYSVASSWDGKFHDIKVEVKKPGYQVYGQRGYFNPLPFNQLSPMEKHLQLLDLALGERAYFEQHLNFPMAALPFSDKKESNTLLISDIPVQRIREAVGDNTEFISLVFNQNKTVVDSKRVEINWGTNKGEKICQYAAASLSPGRYDCRIVIRNLDNGKGAVGACSLDIPETTTTNLKVYPTLLLIPGQEARYLNVSGQDKSGAAKEISLSDIYPFPQKEFSPLVGELEQGASSICGMVRCDWAGTREPEIEFSAWLQAGGVDQKQPLTVDILATGRQAKTDIFILEFELPELQPGRYLLHLSAEDSATNTSSETASGFSIKSRAPGQS